MNRSWISRSKNRTQFFFVLLRFSALSLLALTRPLAAAPCCGGNASTSALITGDVRAAFYAHYLMNTVVGDALPDGTYIFRASDDLELQHSLVFEGAYVLGDRWQVNARLPMIYRVRSNAYEQADHFGFGDASIGAVYEVLPEWTYSSWRPKGFLFSSLAFPLGGSIYDSSSQASAISRGFVSISLGSLWVKKWMHWDASFSIEVHQPFPRRFDVQGLDGNYLVKPGPGFSSVLSGGYTFKSSGLRIGLGISPIYDSGIDIGGSGLSSSSYQLVWSSTLQVAYPFSDSWSVLGTYTDQTFFGPARNVALSRIFGFSLQRTWDR